MSQNCVSIGYNATKIRAWMKQSDWEKIWSVRNVHIQRNAEDILDAQGHEWKYVTLDKSNKESISVNDEVI